MSLFSARKVLGRLHAANFCSGRAQSTRAPQRRCFPLPRAIYPGVGTQAKVASLKYRKTRGIPYVPIQRAQSPQGVCTRQTFFSPRAIYPGLPTAVFFCRAQSTRG